MVLDTSVAVKFYIPEEHHTEAIVLRSALEDGKVEMHAPATILAEALNALWQQYRRGNISREEVREGWNLLSDLPLSLYTIEDLMPRAAEITVETGVIVYDALFVALAEATGAVMITADRRLLVSLNGTPYTHLAHSLVEAGALI